MNKDSFCEELYEGARAYVEAIAVAEPILPRVIGRAAQELAAVDKAGLMPAPTYIVYERAIRSPIRILGTPADSEAGLAYYCPAVLGWLRRAALALEAQDAGAPTRVWAWFARSFRTALAERRNDCRRYGWSRLFRGGVIDDTSVEAELAQLREDWMNGGWAVCLRQWDGHSLVAKEIERARIDALTHQRSRSRQELSLEERTAVLDAVEALEAVVLPFAPHERPHGTPGLYVDAVRSSYGL